MSAMSDWEAIVYFQKLKCIILTFTAYSLSRPSEWKWRKVMDTIHGHHTVFLAKWSHQTDSNILCICTNFPCLEEWDILDIFDKRRMDFYSRAHETVNGKVQWMETMTSASTKLKIKACVPGQPYYFSAFPSIEILFSKKKTPFQFSSTGWYFGIYPEKVIWLKN